MQLTIPKNVRTIIEKLQDEGFEAYAVGGCVRDSYLGVQPNDWDITTNARPEEVKALFRRTIDIGIEHGTVKIMIGDEGYEVTTYRIDGEYEDSRHPKEVTFTGELSEDLRRRDFTINAMAYSERTGIIDLFGGIDDLQKGVIRAVGDPKERFSEDALRILRALRFSARFGYEIEEKTKEAISELAPTLSKISAERIRQELEKLLESDNPDRMIWAYELGVSKVFIPEWDAMIECSQDTPHHFTDVGHHTIVAMNYLVEKYHDMSEKDTRLVRLATFLHDVGKPVMKFSGRDKIDHFTHHPEKGAEMARDILRRLKYDNDTIDRVYKLVYYHDERPALTYPEVRKFIVNVGPDNMDNLIAIKYVDLWAHAKYQWDDKVLNVETLDRMYREIMNNRDCLSLKELAVGGSDLIELGIPAGPKIGEILKTLLYEEVLTDPSRNNRDYLLETVRKMTGSV